MANCEISLACVYQHFFIGGGLGGRNGGFTDGLSFKLWTGSLSVPVFISLSLQPVRLNLYIPLSEIIHEHNKTTAWKQNTHTHSLNGH